jgi:hypothetical protein
MHPNKVPISKEACGVEWSGVEWSVQFTVLYMEWSVQFIDFFLISLKFKLKEIR